MQHRNNDLANLNRNLFERSRSDPTHRLKIDVMPTIKVKVKQLLTEEEKRCLSEDPLDKYLIELTTSRASEVQSMSKAEEIINHVLKEIRSQSAFWATGSAVWVGILGKTEQELQKSREVTLTYKKDLAEFKQKSSYFNKLTPIAFEPKQLQCIVQNYDIYSNFSPEKTFERISFYLIVELKKYLMSIRQQAEIFIQNYLLEVLLCDEKRRKKKRIKNQELDTNQKWVAFLNFVGEKVVESVSTDYEAEQIAIINTIACYELMSTKVDIKYSIEQYEEALDNIEAEFWNQRELEIVASRWQDRFTEKEQVKFNDEIIRLNQSQPTSGIPGCLDLPAHIQQVKKNWAHLKDNPQFQSLSKYKYHHEKRPELSDEEHKKMLEGLLLYYSHPVNNGKIAEFIRAGFPPAYVKNLKNVYMRNMKLRIGNGECGGGEFGDFVSKREFIRRDLENFNIRWFTRTKPVKKRKKLSDSDEPESSWENK